MQMFAVFMVAVIAILVYGIGYNKNFIKKWNPIFKDFSDTYNLRFTAGEGGKYPGATGYYNGHLVNVSIQNHKSGKSSVTTIDFEIELTGLLASRLKISAETFFSRLGKIVDANDMETGDEGFDEDAKVYSGTLAEARAVLSVRARKLIQWFLNIGWMNSFTIDRQRAKVSMTLEQCGSKEELLSVFGKICELAVQLSRKGTVVELLVQNYLADHSISSRIKYLESLADSHAKLGIGHEVIKTALDAASHELQFAGMAAAIPESYPLIPSLFDIAQPSLRIKILQVARDKKATELLEYFEKTCMSETDALVKLSYMLYFSKMQNPGALPFLTNEMEKKEIHSSEYKNALVEALGFCGRFETIEFLHNHKTLLQGRLFDEAIARIQSRIGTGDSGWLSMDKKDSEAGNLSMNEKEEN